MFRFMVISSFLFLMPSFAMEALPDILIFVGNPGVGKSTIINALAQKKVAESGFSIGSGLTEVFSKYEHSYGGKQYLLIDTPGLDDFNRRKAAAIEIEQALKQGGNYKLFFVITLDDGRVRFPDLATIQSVMDAINLDEVTYNVIINKVTPKAKENLINCGIDSILQRVSHKTLSVYYIYRHEYLEDKNNVFFKLSPDLKKFIYEDSKTMFIKESQVGTINTGTIEHLEIHQNPSIELKDDPVAVNAGSPDQKNGKGRRGCVVQ